MAETGSQVPPADEASGNGAVVVIAPTKQVSRIGLRDWISMGRKRKNLTYLERLKGDLRKLDGLEFLGFVHRNRLVMLPCLNLCAMPGPLHKE